MKQNVDKEIRMTVYSSKYQNVREVKITPNATWGGQGLLGVSIRFCSFEGANENVWHILEVHPQSPAEIAGLRSFSDFIIGADSILHESEDLFTLIESHEGRPLKLFVYNTDDDSCREVTIKPFAKWGGEGSLGCGIGYGYLHRIPVRVMAEDHKISKIPDPPVNYSKDTSPLLSNQHLPVPNPNIPMPFVPPLANTFTQFTAPPTAITGINQTVQAPQVSDVSLGISNLNISQDNQQQAQDNTTVSSSNQAPLISTGVPPPSVGIPGGIQSQFNNYIHQQSQLTPVSSNILQPTTSGSGNSYASATVHNPIQQINSFIQPPRPSSPLNHDFPSEIPMYSPNQFSSAPVPLSGNNFVSADAHLSQAYPFEPPIQPTDFKQYNSAALSYPASSFSTNNPQTAPLFSPQTYSTYPQVQGVTSVTTPISLPGMPPITVSTTLPPQALEGLQFGTQVSSTPTSTFIQN